MDYASHPYGTFGFSELHTSDVEGASRLYGACSELVCRDIERMRPFYMQLFGWTFGPDVVTA